LVSGWVSSKISLTTERKTMESNNLYKNGIPKFYGHKYAFWNIRMKTYIHAQGFEIWKSIVDAYIVPVVPPINDNVVKLG
jgi:hypothetical protein